jgi:hypothetical protein
MTLIEIVVSMIILSLAAIGIYSVYSYLGGQQGSGTGSALDNQASYAARETVESLKNAVSADAAGQGVNLQDNAAVTCMNGGTPIAAGSVCTGSGRTYTSAELASLAISTGDLSAKSGNRTYQVWTIADGKGNEAYKKVTVTVSWNG